MGPNPYIPERVQKEPNYANPFVTLKWVQKESNGPTSIVNDRGFN